MHGRIENRVVVRVGGNTVLLVDIIHHLNVNRMGYSAIEHDFNIEAVSGLTGSPQCGCERLPVLGIGRRASRAAQHSFP